MSTGPLEPRELDYRRTADRPAFADLPDEVRARLAELAGGAVVADPSVTSGFTRAYAGRLALADGSAVFAKAADTSAPHARVAIEREAGVLAHLAGRATAPRLVGAAAVDEWRLIVMEAVDGDMPGMPWTPDAAEAVHRGCLAAAEVPADVVAELTTDLLARDLGSDPVALLTLDSLAAGVDPWPGWLAPLAPHHRRELAALARHAATALAGEQVVHGDLRPDNLVVDEAGTARMVDWNWVSRGPAWVDFAGLWPLMAHHGLDVTRWQDSPLLAGVDPDAVDAFLAVVVGLMVDRSRGDDSGPSLAVLRAHQRFTAHTFLALLAGRRGWA
jgi:aminoglycoside phosphotransferase